MTRFLAPYGLSTSSPRSLPGSGCGVRGLLVPRSLRHRYHCLGRALRAFRFYPWRVAPRVSISLAAYILGLFVITNVGKLNAQNNFGLVIHGGAGDGVQPETLGDRAEIYYQTLKEVTDFGFELLENGFSSRDVVEAVIRKLEDNPLFNAGRGAVVNKSGEVYHDASIMLGSDRNAGAVAGIFVAKNPIQAALAVMENTPHVFLSDKGAEEFILQSGVPLMTQEDSAWYNNFTEQKPVSKKGTVGCVALDRNGDLAAGTSTGGMHNKFPGRIGDSPMVGAGTWADNRTCAVSATGHGEYFIRSAAAHSVSAAMLLGDMDVQSACGHALQEVAALGGKGGLIAIDAQGNFAWDFNTVGMFRAVRTHDYKATLVGLGEEVAVYAH